MYGSISVAAHTHTPRIQATEDDVVHCETVKYTNTHDNHIHTHRFANINTMIHKL